MRVQGWGFYLIQSHDTAGHGINRDAGDRTMSWRLTLSEEV